jgi:hypothetical protein
MRHCRLSVIAISSLWAAAACNDGGTGVKLPPCAASFGSHISTVLGSDTMLDPASDSGCVVFENNPSGIDSAIYLVVPQSATGVPGITAGFSLHGDTVRPALAAAGAPFTPRLTVAEQFHDFLRLSEQRRWFGAPPSGPAPARAAPFPAPDTLHQQRAFSVCSNLTCSVFKHITATARAVDSTLVIYVDNAAPANGLSDFDLDTLGKTFDNRLYAVDTSAFGRESDVDGNGKVIVLMTPLVNKLVTKKQCNDAGGGFVAGFFFGADIDPFYAGDSRFNHAEVFYSLVADRDSTLSCPHPVLEVKHVVPVTFIHEFQHMISYNQHVLILDGDPEVLWLNEGFSHYAEELGGRSYLPADSTTFSRFVIPGDLYNAYQYLDSTGNHFLLPTEGIGSLAERGAAWLFVRYLVDQQRSDTSFAASAAVTRPMEATTLTGAANVANTTGVPFDQTVTNWALANYVSDLPGFTAPAALKYSSWAFRTTFASLHSQYPANFIKTFPLTPGITAGSATNVTGTLRAGSGVYRLVAQKSSDPGFTLRFGTSSGGALSTTPVPRLSVIKIK